MEKENTNELTTEAESLLKSKSLPDLMLNIDEFVIPSERIFVSDMMGEYAFLKLQQEKENEVKDLNLSVDIYTIEQVESLQSKLKAKSEILKKMAECLDAAKSVYLPELLLKNINELLNQHNQSK